MSFSSLPLTMVLCWAALPLQSQEARMFRFEPGHTGVSAAVAVRPGSPAWAFPTRGKVRSTPAVSEGVAYFGSEDGHLYAVRLEDGREIWRFRASTEVSSSPALTGDAVVFLGRDNVLRSLDRIRGTERWHLDLGPDAPPPPGIREGWDLWVSSPTVADGRIFIGGGDGGIHAVQASTGQRLWTFKTPQKVRSTPAVVEGRVFVGGFDGHVYALEAATGKECWRFQTGGPVQGSPAVAGGTVFVGSRSAAVFALNATTGALKWRTPHPNGSWVLGSPAVAQGWVLVGSSDEQFLQALDAATGQERWRMVTRYRMLGSPVVAGDVVLCGSEGAYLFALDFATGLMVGMEAVEGPLHTSPVPAGAVILAGSDDNGLHAFKALPIPGRSAASPERLQACAGTFDLGNGRTFTLAPAGGFLRLQVPGLLPSLATLDATGRIHCPALGLDLVAAFPDSGGPSSLGLRRKTGEVRPLRRVP